MVSEPNIDVSNVESCSHENELFVLLVQMEENMGRVAVISMALNLNTSKDCSPRIEPLF